jgi:hypothetical protein
LNTINVIAEATSHPNHAKGGANEAKNTYVIFCMMTKSGTMASALHRNVMCLHDHTDSPTCAYASETDPSNLHGANLLLAADVKFCHDTPTFESYQGSGTMGERTRH